MSFDIFFVRSILGNETVPWKNPFTGEMTKVRPQEPLTDSELQAVRNVLKTVKASEPDEFGHSLIWFNDGGAAEVYVSELETGCTVIPRKGLSPDCLRFLFDLLRAAEWVMMAAMEGNPAIVSAPGIAKEFVDSFPEVVCRSPDELGTILSGGFKAWEQYRDKVVREADGA
jgi:hypothetical protein